ncbi:tetratricopeptide repeat protein [Glycomyces sp. L485]|nr:tetratricopeptide repeat protein [Glycomyces sp. L485]
MARGRVLKAVAKTWPGVVMNAVEARAREYIDAGRFEEAAAVLERAAERYGVESVPRLPLAWSLYKAGRAERAREWAMRAVEAEPENPDAHWVHANVLFELDRRDQAASALWKAVELSPDSGGYYMELAWVSLGHQDFTATRELVEKALDLAPEESWVHCTAGRIFDHHLRHRRAQFHYERALELDPENTEVRYELAAILQARGRISAGVRRVYETAPGPGADDDHAAAYDAVLLRWSWRWYEWALRSAFVLGIADWILPTPRPVALTLTGLLVGGFTVQWIRMFHSLPARCRRDLLAPGRRGHWFASLARTCAVLGGVSAMLLLEPTALQHLGVLAVVVLGYVDWYRRTARIAAD